MSTPREKVRLALEIRASSLEKSAILDDGLLASLPDDVTSIPRSCGLLSEAEVRLTEDYDASALLEMLAVKKVSAVDLLSAFRKRATIAQQCTNCLTELLPEAIEDARACDEHLAQTGTVIGPLHGLPISIKEQIAVGGHRTNAGLVAWADNLVQDDCHMVKVLKKLGAVVFARTNQPQSLMHLETSNNIYGTTVNPKNRQLTVGGSTGGEAALMAMNGTPLGIGGDIGGSIRVPASLNGLYGFVPTVGRIGGMGVVNTTPGHDSIIGTLGPFARSLRDIELFCTAYSSVSPWVEDVSLIPTSILSPALGLQFNEDRPLRIGILADDGIVSPLPPVSHIMKKVSDRLSREAGVEIVPFTPKDHAKGWDIIAANYFEDGGANIRAVCEKGDEPLLPLTEWIINQCQQARSTVAQTPEGLKVARDTFRQEYSDHWNKSNVDVVIAPIYPSTAGPLNATRYWGYSAIWNLLQYPVVALPAAKLVGGASLEELKQVEYTPKNEIEAHYLENYSAESSKDMPVGLQVVAKTLHESLVVRAARVIEEALRG